MRSHFKVLSVTAALHTFRHAGRGQNVYIFFKLVCINYEAAERKTKKVMPLLGSCK